MFYGEGEPAKACEPLDSKSLLRDSKSLFAATETALGVKRDSLAAILDKANVVYVSAVSA